MIRWRCVKWGEITSFILLLGNNDWVQLSNECVTDEEKAVGSYSYWEYKDCVRWSDENASGNQKSVGS